VNRDTNAWGASASSAVARRGIPLIRINNASSAARCSREKRTGSSAKPPVHARAMRDTSRWETGRVFQNSDFLASPDRRSILFA